MSKRKALSAEEKRTKLLEIFHETGEVFQLKELEKLAPKEKGIVQQSVKTTLQELVDEGLVRTEKISGSIFYWAFQKDSLTSIKKQLHEIELSIKSLDSKILAAEEELKAAAAANSDSKVEEAEALQKEIDGLVQQKMKLDQMISTHTNKLNLTVVKNMEQDSKRILVATNRWTDNIFSIKSWCKRKFCKEDRELDKAFGIPEDLDYLDI